MEFDGRDDGDHHGDAQLVAQALAGESAAREGLARRLAVVPRMLREINRRRGAPLGEHDVEDLSQDLLVLIWKKLHRFGAGGTLDAWLYRFCQLEFMNRLRSHLRRRRRVQDLAREANPSEPTVEGESPEGDRLTEALSSLSEAERRVIGLRHDEGLSFPAMEQRCGESQEALKARYYRALQALRRRMVQPDGEDRQ